MKMHLPKFFISIRFELSFGVVAILVLLISTACVAKEPDLKKKFIDRDACFLISDLETGKVIIEYKSKRCKERFTPCSSFKLAAALMAFEKNILKDENQIIKWDGRMRSRSEENRDQTPVSWMSNSVKWVTEWIMPQLGEKNIHHFLEIFEYGNKDFSGGIKKAWVTSSLKISAQEQLNLISKFWKGELSVSKKTTELTKKIIFIKKIGSAELYGKTGTGCLIGHACFNKPSKMIGSFIGILKTNTKAYAFAANASDLNNQARPAGSRLRNTAIEIFEEMGLASD